MDDVNSAGVLLVDIISEALAREILKEKQDNMSTLTDVEGVFGELEKIKQTLIPKLYDLIVTQNMKGLNVTSV